MGLESRKRLAAEELKCSLKKVRFDPERLSEIQEAITKVDIRALIREGVISKKGVNYASRVRARKRARQKRKGRRKGWGKRKGKKHARLSKKEAWMGKIRAQRKLLNDLREKGLAKGVYQKLYLMAKGGFFRSRRHIKLYMEEQGLLKK